MPTQTTVPEDAEQEPSSTRVRPDQIKQSADHAPEQDESDAPASAHMGAVGDEVIHDKPPTDALDKLLKDDDDLASNDELTPG